MPATFEHPPRLRRGVLRGIRDVQFFGVNTERSMQTAADRACGQDGKKEELSARQSGLKWDPVVRVGGVWEG